ncbi:MAG: putative signal transducing protein [Planctomycetota bacterium]|jgi:hypothetical protein
MKKVHVSDNPAEAHFLKSLLEEEGIKCVVENENLMAGYGELPPTMDTLPAVMVVNDEDMDTAREIVDAFNKKRLGRKPESLEPLGPSALSLGIFMILLIALAAWLVLFFIFFPPRN